MASSDKQIARRNIRLQGLINMFAGFLFLTPVVTLLYKYTGLGLVEITLIANVATICMWLFELPTSVLADVVGRRPSLLTAVVFNLLGTLTILLFPQFWGFIVASVFAACYWSFWSGTGQAFLEENLRTLGEEKSFGKVIGRFMFAEQLAGLLCPLVAAGILYFFANSGYTILAAFDVVGALILVILTFLLREVGQTVLLEKEEKKVHRYWQTMSSAISSVRTNKDIRLLVIFRCFANHVSYLPLVIFPVLTRTGMPEYAAGIVGAIATLGVMIVLLLGHRFSEKYSYTASWVTASLLQALLLLIAASVLGNWWLLAVVYILFMACDGLWHPAWNHVLVQVVHGKAIATTRSIVFSIFALYTTLGKQLLSFMPLWVALVVTSIVIVATNIFFAKRLMRLEENL